MSYKSKVAIAKAQKNVGTPGTYSREQLDEVKRMVRAVADGSMGGMKNIVKAGDKVLIKINTVIPSPADNGFTTDPRVLEAVIELVRRATDSRDRTAVIAFMRADHDKVLKLLGRLRERRGAGRLLAGAGHGAGARARAAAAAARAGEGGGEGPGGVAGRRQGNAWRVSDRLDN